MTRPTHIPTLPWRLAALALAALALFALPTAARADITVVSSSAVSEFPEGFRFNLELASDVEIQEIAVRFEVAGRAASQYNYLDFESLGSETGVLTQGEYYHRTNTRDRYSPPGTIVNYFFEITDANGDITTTDPDSLIYMDARYEWDEVTKGPVTTFYHGPVGVRANDMTDVANLTIDNMGPLLGADTTEPVRIIMYNNNAEMIGALATRSSAISSELITEGQAFGDQNVVLLLGNGRRAGGTISHELTHILVDRATSRNPVPVPLWLNEGLAEFGNVDPGFSYERYLEWAVDTDRATPFESLNVFPGDPNLNLVAYGQSRSVIKFLIEEFGREKMTEFMANYNAGLPFNSALRSTYGFDTRGLDELWRAEVGADPLPTPSPRVRPTSTPSPDSESSSSGGTGLLTLESVAAAGQARPTEAPSTENPPEASPAPESTAAAATGSSGGCSAPTTDGDTPLEASSAALLLFPLVTLAYLKLRRR